MRSTESLLSLRANFGVDTAETGPPSGLKTPPLKDPFGDTLGNTLAFPGSAKHQRKMSGKKKGLFCEKHLPSMKDAFLGTERRFIQLHSKTYSKCCPQDHKQTKLKHQVITTITEGKGDPSKDMLVEVTLEWQDGYINQN